MLGKDNQHGPMLLGWRFADREGRKCMLVKSCPGRAKIVERHWFTRGLYRISMGKKRYVSKSWGCETRSHNTHWFVSDIRPLASAIYDKIHQRV